MITYFRDREVLVTSARIRMGGRDYHPADLTRLWHARGRRSWGRIAGRGFLGLAILVPLMIGAAGIVVAIVTDASTSRTVLLAGGGILAGLLVLPVADLLLERVDRSYDRGSHTLEIWARVGGNDVLLLRTDNRQRFGQIYRALQRALEGKPVRR